MKGLELLSVSICGGVLAIGALIKWHKSADKIVLASLILLLCLLVVNMVLVANFASIDHPLVNFGALFFYVNLLLIPPTMHLYVEYYLNENSLARTLNQQFRYYYIPITLFLINLCAFIVVYSSSENSIYYNLSGELSTYANFVALIFIFFLQNVYFIFLAIKRYRTYRQEVGEIFPTQEGLSSHRWIKTFISGYTLFIVMVYLRQLLGAGDMLFAIIIAVYIGFVAYKGFRTQAFSTILSVASQEAETMITFNNVLDRQSLETNRISSLEETTSEKKSLIPQEQQDEIWQRIETLMLKDKTYLNTSLTLYILAKLAETNSKYLRFILKNKSNENFAGYVNSFRVDEAKRLLIGVENNVYTIETIGEMSGFKSKSAFYTTFKEFSGLTPRQYKKEFTAKK